MVKSRETAHTMHILIQRRRSMGKFMSGLGMGMMAGACVGLAAAGMMSDAERRRMMRKAKKAVHTVEDAAASMGLMK